MTAPSGEQMNQWYYSKNGVQMGPVSIRELQTKLAAGEVAWSDLVWRDGMADWTAAGQVAELRPIQSAVVVPGAPPQIPPQSPYVPPAQAYMPPPGGVIPNYLWQSIVVTILCCWPFGIPAIVYAAKVDGLAQRGDYAAARTASDKARFWCWISFRSIAIIFVVYILLAILGAGLSTMHTR